MPRLTLSLSHTHTHTHTHMEAVLASYGTPTCDWKPSSQRVARISESRSGAHVSRASSPGADGCARPSGDLGCRGSGVGRGVCVPAGAREEKDRKSVV